MVNRHYSHSLALSFAGLLTFIILSVGSFALATTPTRIISLGGDLDFGHIPLGASAQRTLTISNGGNSTLTISNFVYPQSPPGVQVAFRGNFPGQLDPRYTAYIYITFTPIASTLNGGTNDLDFQGNLTVESDATSGTNTIAMSGVGTWPPLPPGPHLDLGTTAIETSTGVNVLLTNIGTVPVTVSNVFVPDGFFAGYSGTIEPGGSGNFSVIVTPTAITNYHGIGCVSSDATEPVLVLLTPNGNITNTPSGFNSFSVSGTGRYPAPGKLAGLFMSTNNPRFENCGYFTGTTTAKGKFRGTITLAGKRYPFSSQISSAGTISASVRRKNLPDLHVSLKYNGEVLRIGSVVNGPWMGTLEDGTWTAQFIAQSAPFVSKHGRLPYPPDQYAITIAGSTNASVAPTAAGTGTITINPIDGTRVTGTLADGTQYSLNTIVNISHLPLYVPLYGKRGAILGWINFRYIPPPPVIIPQAINYQISGTLNWFKPPGIDPNYPEGFSFQTTVSGVTP